LNSTQIFYSHVPACSPIYVKDFFKMMHLPSQQAGVDDIDDQVLETPEI